jgi:hypothetical protein
VRVLLSLPGLPALEPAACAAAEELAAYVQTEGLPELELLDAPRTMAQWGEAGCAWAFRRRTYSRRQRALLLARLRKGRPAPTWEICEDGDLIVCTHRNFSWRAQALGHPQEPHHEE